MKHTRTVNSVLRSMGITAVMLGIVIATAAGQSQNLSARYSSAPFAEREVLRYSVSWSFFHLGSIEVRQSRMEGDTRSRVQLRVRTASGIPFIDVDMRDISLLSPDDPRSTDFIVRIDHDPKEYRHYTHDPVSGTFTMLLKEGEGNPVRKKRTEPRRCFDALGVLMYMRGLAGSGENLVIPVLMDYELADTRIIAHREREEVDVDAFDDEVPAYRISVRAGWKEECVGGMDGDYELWCLADGSAIPLRAKIDLALGSISIELKSFRRSGWKPGASTASLERGSGGKGGVR
mgnify:CR=1 FL=1